MLNHKTFEELNFLLSMPREKKNTNINTNIKNNHDDDEEDSNNSMSRNINQVNNGQDCSSKDNSCFNGMCKTTAAATADATMTS